MISLFLLPGFSHVVRLIGNSKSPIGVHGGDG